MKIKLTADNKSYIVTRYVDYILTRMDTLDMFGALKDYLFREKMSYPIDTLNLEIERHCPQILEDHFAEDVVGKETEYAKVIH